MISPLKWLDKKEVFLAGGRKNWEKNSSLTENMFTALTKEYKSPLAFAGFTLGGPQAKRRRKSNSIFQNLFLMPPWNWEEEGKKIPWNMMLPLPQKTTSIFRKFEGGEKSSFFSVCVSLFVEKSIWGKKRSRRGGCTRRDIIAGADLPLKIAPSLLEGKAELGGGKYCLRRLAPLGGMKLRTIYEEIGKRNFPRVSPPLFSRHR